MRIAESPHVHPVVIALSSTPISRTHRTKRIAIGRTLGAILGALIAGVPSGAPASGVAIHTEDVTRFYKFYDNASGHPTAAQIQHDYLDPGSEGLHHLVRVRNVTPSTSSMPSRPNLISIRVLGRALRRFRVCATD